MHNETQTRNTGCSTHRRAGTATLFGGQGQV